MTKNAIFRMKVPAMNRRLVFWAKGKELAGSTRRWPYKALVPFLGIVMFVCLGGQAGVAAPLATTQPSPLKKIVIVFKTHFDIGYSALPKDVVQFYRTSMIDKALTVCDANRDLPPDLQFVWTIPGWPAAQILWDGQEPNRRKRVSDAFKSGRFVVHALPFTTHTETLEMEDLVRGMMFSSRLSRQFGLELPRDAKMTDVPCHSWILPTLLKNAGVDFLHIGCNDLSSTARTPLLFWWEGPDGSRLLTMLSASYGSGLFPPKDWPYKTWLAIVHTSDNEGPPSPEHVKQVLQQVEEQRPEVEVKIGRMSDFADAMIAEKAKAPVIRGDMPDTWIHGPMSDPLGAKTARTLRPRIAATELLNTELRAWGATTKDVRSVITDAYEQSLLYGEHTWGGATQNDAWGGGMRYGQEWKDLREKGNWKKVEASWEAHSDYIRTAERLIRPVLEEELNALAGTVKVVGRRIVVFNPLPWERDGIVTLENAGIACDAVQDVESKAVLPVEIDGDQMRFHARDIPSLGYRTYVPAASPPVAASHTVIDAQAATMENNFFKARLDQARGVIISLIDKRTGREMIDSAAPHAFGQYLYERFDADQTEKYVADYVYSKVDTSFSHFAGPLCFGKPNMPPASKEPYCAASPRGFTLRFQQTPVAAVAIMDAVADPGIPQPVTVRVIMFHDRPCIDLEVTLHDKPLEPWPEAGWLCLPLKVDRPAFQLGRLGAVVDLQRDTVAGSNRDLLCLNHGAAVVDAQGVGVGFYPMDSHLVSFERPGLYRYSRDFLPAKSWIYVNLFNNAWSTNFRSWFGGTWTSRVRLWTFDRYDVGSSLVTPALESRCPLLAATSDAPPGSQPASQAGLELSAKGVLVTAFGPNPDGSGMVLRLWEQAGRGGDCTVRLPVGMDVSSVQPVDLRGRPVGTSLPVSNGVFATPLRAFAPASFILLSH